MLCALHTLLWGSRAERLPNFQAAAERKLQDYLAMRAQQTTGQCVLIQASFMTIARLCVVFIIHVLKTKESVTSPKLSEGIGIAPCRPEHSSY